MIKLYNALVALMVEGKYRPAHGRQGGFKQFTRKNLEQAQELLDWLAAQAFATKPYLVGCFADHNWCYQPRWDRLRNARYQKAYKSGVAWQWWEIVRREERFSKEEEQAESAPSPLHPGHEIVKARYLHTDRCGGFAAGTTCYHLGVSGRFVEASGICQRCNFRGRCR